MKVNDIVSQAFDFCPVRSLQALQEKETLEKLILEYKVSDATAEKTLLPIFKYLYENRDDSLPLLLQGPYGAGKTHTLCLIAGLFNLPNIQEVWAKQIPLKKYQSLEQIIEEVVKLNYNVISINCLDGHDMSFGTLMQEKIRERFSSQGQPLPHSSIYTVIRELSDETSPTRQTFERFFEKEFVNELVKGLTINLHPSEEVLKKLQEAWEKCFKVPIGQIYLPFETVLTSLTDATIRNGYRSTVILLDEWSSYFQIRMGQTGILSELAALQQLLEHSLISRNALKIIAISHASIEETGYWQGSDEAFRVLNKVTGRFSTVQLQPSVTIESISQMFSRKNEFIETMNSLSAIWPIKKYENSTLKALRDTYPLHPFLLDLLPRIMPKHGQAERTINHFLDWAYSRIDENEFYGSDRISIISIVDVFDYYFNTLENRLIADEGTLNSIKELLNKAEKTIYGQDIAKSLIVQYFAYSSAPASAGYKNGLTLMQLCNLVQLSENTVANILETLSGENILFNPDMQLYTFLPSGASSAVELEQEISKLSKEIKYKSAMNLCAQKYDLQSYYRDYYIPFKHRIEFIYQFEDEITKGDNKVRVVFLYPSDENYVQDIADLSHKTKNTLLVQTITLPSEHFLKRYAAIVKMQNKSGRTEYEQAYLRDRLDLVANVLRDQFKVIFDHNNIYVWKDGNKISLQAANWDPIILNILQEIYSGSPKFVLDELKSDRKVVSQIMPYVLKEKGQLPVLNDVRRFFIAIIQGLDLIDINESEDQYQLRIPNEKQLAAWDIWRQVTHIDQPNGITFVYETLNDIPYGLPYTIVELLVAAYLQQGYGKLFRNDEAIPLEVNDLILKEVTAYRSRKFKVITQRTANEWKDKISDLQTLNSLQETGKKAKEALEILKTNDLSNTEIKYFVKALDELKTNGINNTPNLNELVIHSDQIIKLSVAVIAESNILRGIGNTLASITDDKIIIELRKYIKAFSSGNLTELEDLVSFYKSLYEKCLDQFFSEHQSINMFITDLLKEGEINYSEDVLPNLLKSCNSKPFNDLSNGISIVCQNQRCKYALGEIEERKKLIIECFTDIKKDISDINSELNIEKSNVQSDIVSTKREKKVRKDKAVIVFRNQTSAFESKLQLKTDWPISHLVLEIGKLAKALIVALRGNAK